MSNWRHARAAIALIAAYAVALQAILLALGTLVDGAAAFAAQPICAASAGLGTGSVPADHARDCLTACLTGTCGGATALPPFRAAPVMALQAALPHSAALARVPLLRTRVTGAHRSRAPPRA